MVQLELVEPLDRPDNQECQDLLVLLGILVQLVCQDRLVTLELLVNLVPLVRLDSLDHPE